MSNRLNKGFVKHKPGPYFFTKWLNQVVLPFWQEVNSPLSNALLLRYQMGGLDSCLELSNDPSQYLTDISFLHDQQCLALFRKAPFLRGITAKPKISAMKKFIDAEIRCHKTNARLQSWEGASPVINLIFHKAKRKISQYLGDVPDVKELPFRFGPGASYSVAGHNTTSLRKLAQCPETTPEAVRTVSVLLQSTPAYYAYHSSNFCDNGDRRERSRLSLSIVPGSRLSFVPKDAQTDRPICIEPLLNAVIQKGIGTKIAEILRNVGNEIRTGQQRNGRMARYGSETGRLATVDLASASDTIAWYLVYLLLPKDWFDLLDSVRSTRYECEGNWYEFAKFSSMGNGYTFELETLIFLALARATSEVLGLPTKDSVSVYGDDIILPTEAYDTFAEVLSFCGFEINQTKSYNHGPFRESCGSDWFLGKEVRAVYWRRDLSPFSMYTFMNNLKRRGYTHTREGLALWRSIYRLLPRAYQDRVFGPDTGTDGHIILTNEELRARHIDRKRFKTFVLSPLKFSKMRDTDIGLLNGLYEAQTYDRYCTNEFTRNPDLTTWHPNSDGGLKVEEGKVIMPFSEDSFRNMMVVRRRTISDFYHFNENRCAV